MKEYRAYVKNHCLWILWVAILGSIGLWLLGWTNHITGWYLFFILSITNS